LLSELGSCVLSCRVDHDVLSHVGVVASST
jgi:hypothetical protein